jgi:hypothetical protein
VGSNGIFDAFDGEAADEAPDGDVVSSIEDESREQPQANPFDKAGTNAAPKPETAENGQNQASESDASREMGTDRKTVEEQQPFTPSKEPAAAVLNDGPRKLNKQLILYIGVGILAVFIIGATFIAPPVPDEEIPVRQKNRYRRP